MLLKTSTIFSLLSATVVCYIKARTIKKYILFRLIRLAQTLTNRPNVIPILRVVAKYPCCDDYDNDCLTQSEEISGGEGAETGGPRGM